MVYAVLNESEFTGSKLIDKQKETVKEGLEKGTLLYQCDDGKQNNRVEEIDDSGELWIVSETPLGYYSCNVKLDDETIIKIIEITTKRLNKFKSLLESMKK